MRLRLILTLIAGLLLAAFQNCAKSVGSGGEGSGFAGQTVIGTTSQYKKIVYDPQLEAVATPAAAHLEVDIDSGSLSLAQGTSLYQCAIDEARLAALKDLLAVSEICKPGPLPAGTYSCAAIFPADIELSNESASVKLRRDFCNSGIYLCDGNDERFRALLSDLEANLPAGCSP